MIAVFDLHDRAHAVWREAGVSQAVLVHVDAHHDAAHAATWQVVDIGNYIRAAIRDGLVREVRWVIPDPMWRDRHSRRVLLRELRHIGGPATAAPSGAHTLVEGVPFWLGPLEGLGEVAGRVLLNVDVDYLLTARQERRRTAEPLAMPWRWPDALVSQLRDAGLAPMVTTIATSVTGGFTPMLWAHLGRELAGRLDGSATPAMLTAFAHLERAAERRAVGDVDAALADCRLAVSACPGEAAAHFHLAEDLRSGNAIEEARAAYCRARDLDALYGHPFRTRGPVLYRRGRFAAARAEYLAALVLDPDDPHAHLGLAMIAMREGRAADARALAELSLSGDPGALDGWRTLARALVKLGEPQAAIRAYERALALSLAGAAPLGGPWSSNPSRRLVDPRHWDDHAAAGSLQASLGSLDAAIVHYRMAAAGGPDTRRRRARLALLQARRRLGRAFGGMLPS